MDSHHSLLNGPQISYPSPKLVSDTKVPTNVFDTPGCFVSAIASQTFMMWPLPKTSPDTLMNSK